MSSTSPINPSAKPPRRFLVRAVFIVACLATLIVALFIEEKIRGRAAWRAYETEARARGVKLDFADYIPPAIPDAENFASIPIFDDAFRASHANQPMPNPLSLLAQPDNKLPKFDSPMRGERIDLAAWQEFFVKAKLLPAAGDNPAADVLKALDTFAAPLAQLREAGTRPHCRFPVQWEKGFAVTFPHIDILERAIGLYALRLSAHLALGDSAAACVDFRDGLRLVTATTAEPSLLAGLVRISLARVMENAAWGGLAGQQWAEPELRKIETDLAGLDWLSDYLFAMGSERGSSNTMTDMLINNPRHLADIMQLTVPGNASLPFAWTYSLYPSGWLYQSKVRSNRFFDEMSARIDPAQRRYFGERPVHSGSEIKSLPKRIYYLLFATMTPGLENVEKRYVQAATVTDQTRLACALERFRIARGAFPEALSELTPGFVASLPVEIVNGEPYRYRRTDDGSFLLYSVGLDLRDDDGIIDPKLRADWRASPTDQPDWVWRYPAK